MKNSSKLHERGDGNRPKNAAKMKPPTAVARNEGGGYL